MTAMLQAGEIGTIVPDSVTEVFSNDLEKFSYLLNQEVHPAQISHEEDPAVKSPVVSPAVL